MAGIIASLALTFSMAETVVASMCALPPVWQGEAAAESIPAGDDCMMTTPDGRSGDRKGDGASRCPFGPGAAARGCVTAASLPAPSIRMGTVAVDTSVSPLVVVRWNDLLLETILFHPPKT
jgi:hypothetical protein